MPKAIISKSTPEKCIKSLIKYGFDIISLPPFSALPTPVSAHTDMLLFILGNKLICHRDYFNAAEEEITNITSQGYELLLSEEYISDSYPHDILFNSLVLGDTLYCLEGHTSKHIINTAKEYNLSIHYVKQGYAKCSVCPISDSAAISADPSICLAMSKDGIDVLQISSGNILLSGYDTGFIGGCSGVWKDTVYFLGNIALHPDAEKIEGFCHIHGKRVISLSEEPLFDAGSLFFI